MSATESDDIDYDIYSESGNEESLHCQGRALWSGSASPEQVDIGQLRDQMQRMLNTDRVYESLARMGLHYGPAHRSIVSLYLGDHQLLAHLRLPEVIQGEREPYVLHPSMMDGALQAVSLLAEDWAAGLPRALESLRILSATEDEMTVWARYSSSGLDLDMMDRDGNVCITMKGLEMSGVDTGDTGAPVTSRSQLFSMSSQDDAEGDAGLRSFLPVWNSLGLDASDQVVLPHSAKVLMVGCASKSLDWLRRCYPNAQLLELTRHATVNVIAEKLAACSFDQLLWISPDAMDEDASRNESNEDIVRQQEEGVLAVFRIAKALLHSGYAHQELSWTVMTRMTQLVTGNETVCPAHAGVFGLIGSLAKEYPRWNLRLLDLDSLTAVTARQCFSLPWNKKGNALAHRQGAWLQEVLSPIAALPEAHPIYRRNGVYVVIGGAGGLGEVWTRFMIEHYQANVIWIGRRRYNSEIEQSIDSLSRLGPSPTYIANDAAKLEDLEEALQTILSIYPTVHGVVHSATIVFDRSLANMEESDFRAGLSAKVDVSVNIDKVFGQQDLDFLLFFSSAVSFFKSAGQSNYAAGCTFKDSFAQKLRQQRSYPVKTVNWGSVGIVASESYRRSKEPTSFGSIGTQEAMASLQAFVNSTVPQMALIQTLNAQAAAGLMPESTTHDSTPTRELPDTTQPLRANHDRKPQSVLAQSNAVASYTREANAAPQVRKDLTPSAGKLDGQSRADTTRRSAPKIEDLVRTSILDSLCSVLKITPEDVDGDTAFSDYGIDSILCVKFIEGVNQRLAIELSTAVIFESSSLDRLSKYVMQTHRQQIEASIHEEPAPPPAVEASAVRRVDVASVKQNGLPRRRPAAPQPANRQNHRNPAPNVAEIAVIGISGMFPGAENIEEFWVNLAQGADAIKELPPNYLNQDLYFSPKKQRGKTCCKWGGILESRDCFDPLFFSISPREAEAMNPHQRLVMQEGWKAIEDAGYNPRLLSGSQTGIFIGAEPTGYVADSFTGYSDAIIASRLSYILNLSGPALMVNTGCSSSGVAIHLACESLRNHETDLALAGGVNACMEERVQISLDDAGILSPTGRCRTFDGAADGTVVSEAVALVVLKRLADAVRDGDLIYGVISGSGINQDGTSNGITAPNGAAQEQLIVNVYKKFAIDPEKIGYVEAHGTGTKLGDPVEANALVRAFRNFTAETGYCAVGSAKSHVGHTAAAAGATGLIKVLLSLRHKRIPRLLHFDALNPLIKFDQSPFYIPTDGCEWKSNEGESRMASLNSFGHSGTNAHLVVREYLDGRRVPGVSNPRGSGPVLVPLSAKTAEQLRQQVMNLLNFLQRGATTSKGQSEPVDMAALSYTLQTARESMEERLGFIVDSLDQLIGKLRAYLDGKQAEGVYRAKAKRSLKAAVHEATEEAMHDRNLPKLCQLWVDGTQLDWATLHGRLRPGRMRLPTYPFAKERYWAQGNLMKPAHEHVILNGNTGSVQDILEKIDQMLLDEQEGTRMLKSLVTI